MRAPESDQAASERPTIPSSADAAQSSTPAPEGLPARASKKILTAAEIYRQSKKRRPDATLAPFGHHHLGSESAFSSPMATPPILSSSSRPPSRLGTETPLLSPDTAAKISSKTFAMSSPLLHDVIRTASSPRPPDVPASNSELVESETVEPLVSSSLHTNGHEKTESPVPADPIITPPPLSLTPAIPEITEAPPAPPPPPVAEISAIAMDAEPGSSSPSVEKPLPVPSPPSNPPITVPDADVAAAAPAPSVDITVAPVEPAPSTVSAPIPEPKSPPSSPERDELAEDDSEYIPPSSHATPGPSSPRKSIISTRKRRIMDSTPPESSLSPPPGSTDLKRRRTRKEPDFAKMQHSHRWRLEVSTVEPVSESTPPPIPQPTPAAPAPPTVTTPPYTAPAPTQHPSLSMAASAWLAATASSSREPTASVLSPSPQPSTSTPGPKPSTSILDLGLIPPAPPPPRRKKHVAHEDKASQIEARRARNKEAARKHRQKKAATLEEITRGLDEVTRERDFWKAKALELKARYEPDSDLTYP